MHIMKIHWELLKILSRTIFQLQPIKAQIISIQLFTNQGQFSYWFIDWLVVFYGVSAIF